MGRLSAALEHIHLLQRVCDRGHNALRCTARLISPRVRQAVEKAVTVEPVGEFALKGIRRPIANVQRPGARKFQTELMSAFGTKRTFQSRSAMSAFGGKADITRTWADVRTALWVGQAID